MRVKVDIVRRAEIADPQGVTTVRALRDLGFDEVSAARFNRTIVLDVELGDANAAVSRVEAMCRQVLANPVIEDFTVQVVDE